jgi:hypothetical protein
VIHDEERTDMARGHDLDGPQHGILGPNGKNLSAFDPQELTYGLHTNPHNPARYQRLQRCFE